MKPPDIITRYFQATNAGLTDEACLCFSTDARVEDEGNTWSGREAIRNWLRETTDNYQPRSEPLHSEDKNGVTEVRARVSGNFPGSPVELDFQFTITGETISNLSIQ